jgi:hypothetical protein
MSDWREIAREFGLIGDQREYFPSWHEVQRLSEEILSLREQLIRHETILPERDAWMSEAAAMRGKITSLNFRLTQETIYSSKLRMALEEAYIKGRAADDEVFAALALPPPREEK